MNRLIFGLIVLAAHAAAIAQVYSPPPAMVCHQVCYHPLVWVINHYEQGPLKCYCNWGH